jgi:ATP phosphoribosyltransferase regulatory subunit
MDVVLRAVPRAERPRRLYLPADVALDARRQWQQSGWITIAGLEPAEDVAAEAARLGCDHVLVDGAPVDIRKPD